MQWVAILAALVGTLGALTDLEAKFLKIPQASMAREHLEHITSFEHVAGTPGDLKSAQYVLDSFKKFGLSAEIQPYKALVSYPVSSSLRVYDSDRSKVFEADLNEPALPVDETSSYSILKNLSFHGYAPSGSVRGELVYVNYGRPEDFKFLTEQLGLDLRGKIALVRYGKVFRGLKVKNAQEYGMIGCIVYSDPADDGFAFGNVYPSGPWRPEFSVQRGSVQFNSLCAGDPGLVERDPDICGFRSDELIPRIPSIPLSYQNAQKLFELMGNNAQPPHDWIGSLSGYSVGPSSRQVELEVANRFENATQWNVVAKITGILKPEQEVILGNHRDAWVFGAVDPNSAVLLELARSFGVLLRSGWRPLRTITLCSWDGEEYGLLGSTRFGEKFADQLTKNAIAYLNVDVGVSGQHFQASMTPSLLDLVKSAANDITDPVQIASTWTSEPGRLGSGSDYTVFLDHLGIPSVDMSFVISDDAPYGVYHSVYDSFSWMTRFGDPDFTYHQAMTQMWGLMALRLSDADLLPFNYVRYADELRKYIDELDHVIKPLDIHFELSPLASAIAKLRTLAMRLSENEEISRNSDAKDQVNLLFRQGERYFLSQKGLPGRKWFKHVVQAPGINLGYGSEVFPGLQEAIRAKDLDLAKSQRDEIADLIFSLAEQFGQFVSSSRE